ncbi:MAG: alpha-ribazole phosphatase [Nitrospirae bacterium]|nr:MAG: alpha-ribazole phosphatase [Nitrospirota bacterium]
MRLYLIRHGEITGAHTRRYNGHRDVELSENGRIQIERLAEYLRERVEIDAFYSSDLKRSIDSARIIADRYQSRPIAIPDIRERNFGEWEGMTFDEICEKYPNAFYSWAKDPLNYSPIGGESTIEVRDRIMPVIEELSKKHRSDTIAIVGHGGINRIIICELLGIPLKNIFRIEQDFGALNIIDFFENINIVKLVNLTLE